MLTVVQIVILGLIQGAAELLPVSSSAHVVVAEKLMGVDPSTPEAMYVLAMLHTGTMLAVLVYFWRAWRDRYFSSAERFAAVAVKAVIATAITGVVGYALVALIEHRFLHGGDAEELARNLPLIAGCLVASGVVILIAGPKTTRPDNQPDVRPACAAWMGLAQALVLPFRGFSRSGSTISIGVLAGADRRPAEEFSFALAIILTPAVIVREFHRMMKEHRAQVHSAAFNHLLAPGFLGLFCSFIAGLLALRWLSRWLEQGRWAYFGIYCLAAAAVVAVFAASGL